MLNRLAVEAGLPADLAERVRALRPTWRHRLAIWGYRIMLLALPLGGGMAVWTRVPAWAVVMPAGIVAGYLLTVPLSMYAQSKLCVPPGMARRQAFSGVRP